AYAIVNADQTTQLWLNRSQLTSAASNQLSKVNIHPYGSFLSDLNQLANQNDISQIWISSSASQAIFNRIPKEKLLIASHQSDETN
ncbi:unnamed protein product, partial [Rotaria magnacalcarata]